jgi:hypothetical protein
VVLGHWHNDRGTSPLPGLITVAMRSTRHHRAGATEAAQQFIDPGDEGPIVGLGEPSPVLLASNELTDHSKVSDRHAVGSEAVRIVGEVRSAVK